MAPSGHEEMPRRAPLHGARVVVTQRADLAPPLASLLRQAGAKVLEIPATRFRPPQDPEPMREAIGNLLVFDWVVLSNPCGAEFFLAAYGQRHTDLTALKTLRLATCGPLTAGRLQAQGLFPDAIAADHKTPLILEALAAAGGVAGQRVLLLRGEETLPGLPEALRAEGAEVEDVASFGTEPERADPSGDATRLRKSGADWILFASGLAIEHFHHRFDLPGLQERFPFLRFGLASPSIRRQLEHHGLRAAAIAQPNDPQSLVDALVDAGPAPPPTGSAEKSLEAG
jgi:uroporphyrinogen III methyltransferase/synthase